MPRVLDLCASICCTAVVCCSIWKHPSTWICAVAWSDRLWDDSAAKRTQSFLQLVVFSRLGFVYWVRCFDDFGWHPSVSLSIGARSNHRAILALSLCRIAYRDNIAFKERSKDFLQSVLPGFVRIRTCFVSCVMMWGVFFPVYLQTWAA
jgi:hypothetical protein